MNPFTKTKCALYRSGSHCAITSRRRCCFCPYFQEPIDGLQVRDYVTLYSQKQMAKVSFLFSFAALVISMLTLIITAVKVLTQVGDVLWK